MIHLIFVRNKALVILLRKHEETCDTFNLCEKQSIGYIVKETCDTFNLCEKQSIGLIVEETCDTFNLREK